MTLRRGGRTLGGALSWEKPAQLAPFAAVSPFAGLAIPADVTVSRQVLAEPTLDLAGKTWARLTDGTPLVTAEKRGKGWLVLVHTTADPEWSNLAISGLFVNMLRRIVAVSQGVSGTSDQALPPVETLDGYGRLQPRAGHGRDHRRRRLRRDARLGAPSAGLLRHRRCAPRPQSRAGGARRFAPLGALPPGVARESYARRREVDFRPGLLGAALALALIDLVIAFALRGLLPRLSRGGAAGALVLAVLVA